MKAPDPARTRVPVRRCSGINPALMDVMCTLVFLFLLTSLLAESARSTVKNQEQQLPPVTLPKLSQNSVAKQPEQPRRVITISAGPKYHLDAVEKTLEAIAAELAASPGAEVEIRGDSSVEYGAIIKAVAACQAGRVSRFFLNYESSTSTP